MEVIVWDWINFVARWLHVTAGIAWIGSSFYFIHLDASLRKRDGLPPGVAGEAWQIHGGGFYHMRKFMVAPPALPEEMTWFKWEAYTTWISGFFLLIVLYYRGADLFLVDPAVADLSPAMAIAVSVGSLAVGWLAYDGLCRSPVGRSDGQLSVAVFFLVVALAWGLSQLLGGRGALLQTGAVIGTMMVANVFLVIMPNQRKAVAEMLAGRAPDPGLGRRSKQRSLHNNYLTLPVIFLMVSNHYPLAFDGRFNWVFVALVLVVGTSIRHFFNLRHAGRPSPWWTWGVAAAGVLLMVAFSAPRLFLPDSPGQAEASALPQAPEDIVIVRCGMCHAAAPLWPGLAAAPRGVRLDTPEEVRRRALQIRQQAVLTHAMPPGNVTAVSPEERRVLGDWTERMLSGR